LEIFIVKPGHSFQIQVGAILMTVEKNTIILILIFVCGLLAGVVFTGLLSPQQTHVAKQVVFTDKAPHPIGPYSQAVISGNFVFVSGQVGIDPATGNISGTAGEQTTRSMENLRTVLQESGLGFEDVVQKRIYLVNMSDWTMVNTIYGSYFTDNYPARATVQVAGLPKGALVEIEMVAQKRQGISDTP
jgi:2-iminobutanoate/2-iminopropanoate deaminase